MSRLLCCLLVAGCSAPAGGPADLGIAVDMTPDQASPVTGCVPQNDACPAGRKCIETLMCSTYGMAPCYDVGSCGSLTGQLQAGARCTASDSKDNCDKGLWCSRWSGVCRPACAIDSDCGASQVCVKSLLNPGFSYECHGYGTCEQLCGTGQACGGGESCSAQVDDRACSNQGTVCGAVVDGGA